jgi:EF-P beta-lysylation protein EpmB
VSSSNNLIAIQSSSAPTANISVDETNSSSSQKNWQHQLSHCIKDLASLCDFLQLDPQKLPFSDQASQQFPLQVPIAFANRMRKGDYNDPLLLQILPVAKEMALTPGFVTDPLAEAQAKKLPGLIHKYKHRVLLTLSGACAINCRYCFRRHFPYSENSIASKQWQDILSYLKKNNSIEEVIFSGGDPLASSDTRLANFITDLAQISHIKRLRIHTRLPVVIPDRITDKLCSILNTSPLECVVVIHANHANEFDSNVKQALTKLRESGATVLNQAVLLKGINDTVATQKALHSSSFSAGALPYYLFVLDPVQGAAHFDIEDQQAQQLVRELQSVLPGYLVPKLAREIPDKPNKTLLSI